jgi:hypothetical protein
MFEKWPTVPIRILARCALLTVVCAGCGPIQSSGAISESTERLEVAERLEAAKYARYRYNKARLLLAEAKLKHGHGHYEIARQWAEQAGDLATEAAGNARSRKELERRRLRFRKGSRTPTPGKRPLQTGPKTKPTDPAATPGKAKPGTGKPATGKPVERKKILPPNTGRRKILPPGMKK